MKLFYENGAIDIGDNYLSPRITTEILNEYFNISVIEQRSFYLKLGILRFAKLYGFPYIGPHSKVEIWLDNNNAQLRYKFFWPEYYILIFMFVMTLCIGIVTGDLTDLIVLLPLALCFFGLLMFLDTRWVVSRCRKAFKLSVKC